MHRPAFATRRTVLFTLLYASEGAPIGFIWWALPTLLRDAGAPIERITGLTALVVLPWALKFAWAPLVDALRTPRWGFRAWIVAAQTAMALALLPLVWLDPVERFDAWRVLLLLHAVAAATQDVAIDALAIGTVPPAERGRLNGAMQAGMLAGRSLFGGGALVVAVWLGRGWVVAALVAWIWVALAAAFLAREPDLPAPTARARLAAFREALRHAGRRRATWFGLAFALVSAAAFEATGQLAGPFLVDRGVSTPAIGVFFGLPVVAATLAGGLVGGVLSDRWGRVRSVSVFLLGFVAAVAGLAAADLAGAGSPVLLAVLTGMYLFVGLFTAASYALFMDLTDARLGATQFSAYMAGTNACESWSAWAGGRLAAAGGYPLAFVVMSVASVVSLYTLAFVGASGATGRQGTAGES